MDSTVEIYLRRSGLRSPRDEGQTPSKAAVLSEARSHVSAADPRRLCKSPPPHVSTQLQPVRTPLCGGAMRSRTWHFLERTAIFTRRNMKESKQTTCSIPSVFAYVSCVCVCVCLCVCASSPVRHSKAVHIRYICLYFIPGGGQSE